MHPQTFSEEHSGLAHDPILQDGAVPLAAIAELCRGPLFVVGLDLRYQWVTAWYAGLFGLDRPAQMIGRSMRDFLPAQFCDEWQMLVIRAAKSGEVFSVCHMFAGARTFANVYKLVNCPTPAVFIALTVEDPLVSTARVRIEAHLPPSGRTVYARHPHMGPFRSLSATQMDTLRLLAMGRDLIQISQVLDIDPEQVSRLIDSAQSMLQMDSAPALSVFAFEKGLHLYTEPEWAHVIRACNELAGQPYSR